MTVDRNAFFVRNGNTWTSTGVAAGMDLALALVEMDWGHAIALQVARYNVMFMMRPGGQSQFSAHLVALKARSAAAPSPVADLTLGVGLIRAALVLGAGMLAMSPPNRPSTSSPPTPPSRRSAGKPCMRSSSASAAATRSPAASGSCR